MKKELLEEVVKELSTKYSKSEKLECLLIKICMDFDIINYQNVINEFDKTGKLK